MRLERSVKNSSAVFIGQMLSMGLSFLTRTVFMYSLSRDYLGLNGLFTSFLSLLSLSELGIGTAITYALYKPLATGDEEQISALMNLFSKAYRIIGIVIAIAGVLLYPFIDFFVKDIPDVSHIGVIYGMFLANTALSYFFSYRRTLITADQRDWINTVNQSIFLIIQNVLQILLLLLTKEYLLYLSAQILCTVLCNAMIFRKSDRLYPFLRRNRDKRVSPETFRGIRKNVAAMLMHQISSVVVTGTDNMLIAWANIALLANYSNYTLITQTLTTILRQIFSAVTASLGNLVATEDISHQRRLYGRIFFVNFWLYGFFAAALGVMLDPFITAWAPDGYLLSGTTTLLIVVNFYLFGMRRTNIMYIDACGLFWPLRYKGIAEAAVNLIASFFFLAVLDMGIDGVLLGTVVSSLTTNFWWEPLVVVGKQLQERISRFFLKYLAYTLLALAGYALARWLCTFIPGSGWMAFFIKGVVSTISINLLFAAVLWRTDGARYLLEKLKGVLHRH